MVSSTHPECQGESGLSAREKAGGFASRTTLGALALALPSFIVFGRGALGVALGIAVLALIAAATSGLRWRLWGNPLRPTLTAMAILTLAWLPSVAGSLQPGLSALTLIRTAALIAGGAILVDFARQDNSDWPLRVFVTGMLIALTFAVVALFVTPSIAFFRAHNGVAVPRFALKSAASAIACALPVLIYAAWRLRGRWVWVVAVGLPLGLAVMYGTSSRSSLAGVLAALVLCGIVAATRRKPLLYLFGALALTVLAGTAAIAVALHWNEQRTLGGYDTFAPYWLVDLHRQTIWQFTLDRFLERPWFGWGLNAIAAYPGADRMIPELKGEFIPSHPHNWMIESLAESGVVGFVPLLVIIAAVAVAAGRGYRRSGDRATLTWLALWLSYWAAGAFNFSMWNASWQVSGLVLAALVCSWGGQEARP